MSLFGLRGAFLSALRPQVATLNRLKVCHNDILKRLLRLPRWSSSSLAFARNGVNNLDVIRRHSAFSTMSRVELSANSIITSVRQSSAYVRRLCDAVAGSGPARLEGLLRKRFPQATAVEVQDISGGCGSMYEVWVEAQDFKGLSRVKQHKLITETLKVEIQDMHGLRITTTLPDAS
ncbi:BolA-like protein 3 [Chionoecetes opilio]|uniref:BolA-like protein 3 n=1 Tax=Chionoecetes opilio TaxID=41210 RepID=A0A8J5CRZ6_CHIOP|nr:BolA-like protein 3 [Chionoecetes opilio]